MFSGLVCGGLFWGIVSDKIGRKMVSRVCKFIFRTLKRIIELYAKPMTVISNIRL